MHLAKITKGFRGRWCGKRCPVAWDPQNSRGQELRVFPEHSPGSRFWQSREYFCCCGGTGSGRTQSPSAGTNCETDKGLARVIYDPEEKWPLCG